MARRSHRHRGRGFSHPPVKGSRGEYGVHIRAGWKDRPCHYPEGKGRGNCILLFGGANQQITREMVDGVMDHF